MDIPEVPPWLLDTSVDVNEEGEEDSEGKVDIGVDALVATTFMIKPRQLPGSRCV